MGKRRSWAAACLVLGAAVAAAAGPPAVVAAQPAALGSDTPAVVSAQPLPTVQVDGIVWAQEVVGNVVYATGSFTSARPSGAAAGTQEVPRERLLAYDIRTGELLPFRHRLNGQGLALAVSPDRRRLYVGGEFTRVDGKPRSRLAAFRIADGALLDGYRAGPAGAVTAIAATNQTVYVGGRFTRAAGKPRIRLAAFTADGQLTRWRPEADDRVSALIVSPDRSKVVIGGDFLRVNDRRFFGLAAVRPTGPGRAVLDWASRSTSFPIRNDASGSGITSLSGNRDLIFLTSYNFGDKGRPGAFEGRAAIDPADGRLVWANDCHGDSYDSVPIGPVLYSVGHAHDCEPAGAFPDTYWPGGAKRYWRALAETITPDGDTNGPPTNGYTSFEGVPRTDQLVWYPSLNAGTQSGQQQSAWSIVGNSSYVSLGGEFTRVQGVAQQGLVRYATAAPGSAPPADFPDGSATVAPSPGGGVTVSWPETWDPDDATLDYTVSRLGGATVCEVDDQESRFWLLDTLSCVDPAGSISTRYQVLVEDPDLNSERVNSD